MDAAELVDLGDPGFIRDPYPRMAEFRRRAPLAWHSGLGVQVATSHALCSQVLRSRALGRTYAVRQPAADWSSFNALHADALLELEPPRHTRLRRLVQGGFGRGHVERLQPRIADLARTLLDRCAEQQEADGSVDLIAGYAEPLPVLVIAELLGWPPNDTHQLRDWSQAIVAMYEPNPTVHAQRRAERASEEFVATVTALAEERAAVPGDDLLSDLVAARDEGDRLSASELVATVVLLLDAGHEASVNGFGNGLVSLLASGTQPPTSPALVEELLRHDPPLQLFERTVLAEVEIGGTTLRPGDRVAALLGAANRDPAVFPDPDRFDPGRTPNLQLAFGAGIHFCVGAPLARLELRLSMEAVRSRWPRLSLVDAVRRDTFVLRGYRELRVSLG